MKLNDQILKQAHSLFYGGNKYRTNTNWNATQPCVYDGDNFPNKYSRGRKTTDDLLKWVSHKAENRSS